LTIPTSRTSPIPTDAVRAVVQRVVQSIAVTDIHTHLYAPAFDSLLLSGADELLFLQYIVAESFRTHHLPYETFWNMTKEERATLIWNELFVHRSPLSEATSGVIEIAKSFGCDVQTLSLASLRSALSDVATETYTARVLDMAGVESVVMTNDPFDPIERAYWLASPSRHSRFHAALRLDRLLNHYDEVYPELQSWGYTVKEQLDETSVNELRRFLTDWMDRMNALYVAFSAPDDFAYPTDSIRARLLDEVILPVCRSAGRPLALMIGARRGVNPLLRDAGDSLGKADIRSIEALCARYPDNKFLVTLLSRESQHELVVTARKFHNLMIFGCWWFVNTGSLVDEVTRMRLELLGPTFIAQHSDARVLEQLIYKWQRARKHLTDVLSDRYRELVQNGWGLIEEDIQRDVLYLLRDNFWSFVRP